MMIHHALLSGVSAAAITAHLGTPGPSLPWVTVAEWVPNDNSAGWAGYTVRQKILASVLSAEGSMARLTFTAHTTGLAVTNCYIGYAAGSDSDFDFFDVPTQVTFGGGDPGFDIGASAVIRSDPIDFEYEAGRDIIVAWHVPDDAGTKGTLVSRGSQTGWDRVYKDTGTTSDADTVDASGYSSIGVSACIGMTEIEFILSGAASGTSLRIPPWRIPSDLTGFPVAVDLADMPDSFWSATTEDGGNIRVTNAAGVPLPFDIVFFDRGEKQGRLFFKANLSTASNNDFKVITQTGATALAPTDTYGRNAVWSAFEAMFAFESLVDRTGKGHDATLSGSSSTYDYGPSATRGEPGWLNLAGAGQAKTNVVPAFTSWVIGASYIPRATTQGAIVSYSKDEVDNTTRSTMAHRNGVTLDIWNTNDTWLNPAQTNMELLRQYRGHMLHDGTTLRKIFYNGILRGTDNTVTQKPGAGSTPILFIGAEDASLSERASGSINYVYLHGGVLSDDWLKVEGMSWVWPSVLYDVLDRADANAGEKVDFTNPAADTDVTGWTNRYGSAPVRTTSCYRSSPAAFAAGNAAVTWWDQELTVPAGQETYIDAGAVLVEVPFWQQGSTDDTDEAGPTLGFFDGSGNLLARRFWPREDVPGNTGNWQPRKASCAVPVGTRKVRWGVNGKRLGGIELSQYVDDIGPMEFKALPGYLSERIYWNLGGSTTGKVDVTGTLGVCNNTRVWNATTNNVLYWAADAAGEAYFPIDVTSRATEIDAEGCRIDAYVFQSSYDNQDSGQAYIEFRDGSGTLLGSREVFSAEFIAPIQGVGLFLDLAVPANTRSIRFGLKGTRTSGTALDAYFQWLNVFLKKPRS